MTGSGGYSSDSALKASASSQVTVDGVPTLTSRDQLKAEQDVLGCFKAYLAKAEKTGEPAEEGIGLNREQHCSWLQRGLRGLPTNFAGLDASRPWFVFWISHALELLGDFDDTVWPGQVASFLKHCQDATGGFGGGPGQLPHLAPTYAAVSALMIAGCEDAYSVPDRAATYGFLMRMKHPDGGFRMHSEGETDMRGTYCAIAVASMLHIVTDELIQGVPEYVQRCQTYEGGIAGEAGLEAHGGYSYCGLAALCIIGKAHVLDLHALLNWAAHRQMPLEGGFAGRTNKLVDSCYSFWQGAIFPLIHEAFRQQGEAAPPLPDRDYWFKPQPLQTYVFLACQHPSGGLRDKPGKSADFYHTCYSLSGVAAAQLAPWCQDSNCIVGDTGNLLERCDLFYNVLLEKSKRKVGFYAALGAFTLPNGREVSGEEGAGVAEARRYALLRANVVLVGDEGTESPAS